ncbi:Clp protease N-terminal domain-containing protein [Streptomyces sp. M19]
MLLGLIRVEDSPAARILRELGFASEELHETVTAEIAERTPRATSRDERPAVSPSGPHGHGRRGVG